MKNVRNETVVTVISSIAEQPAAKEACMVVIYGDDLGRKFNLAAPSILVGRSNTSDIQIDQESVSRNHAKILNTGKSVILRDLGSTNGTYVNDDLIDERMLRDGDLIKIGRTIFKFLTGGNVENAYHEEIYRLTTIDGLTQIFNKRYFMEMLEREISRAHRYRRALTLIFFDIDHFKSINDTYGHLAGDHVLRHLALTVKNNIRREDIFARYGGEEFAIILPEVDLASSRLVAEKVRKVVAATQFRFEETDIPLTISLGLAECTDDLNEPADFIKLADEKLYQAKEGGRNRACG